MAAQMVKDLNHYPYRDALEREKIQAKLGPELTADLYVNTSWRDRPPTAVRRAWTKSSIRISTMKILPRGPAGGSVTQRIEVPRSRVVRAHPIPMQMHAW